MKEARLISSSSYLTVRQACQELQVCRNTMMAMITAGVVNAVNLRRPGSRNDIWRIDLSNVGVEISIKEKIKLQQIEKRLANFL
jgi:hypothetical protein